MLFHSLFSLELTRALLETLGVSSEQRLIATLCFCIPGGFYFPPFKGIFFLRFTLPSTTLRNTLRHINNGASIGFYGRKAGSGRACKEPFWYRGK